MIKQAKEQTVKVTSALKNAAFTVQDMKSKVSNMITKMRTNISKEITRLNNEVRNDGADLVQIKKEKCSSFEALFKPDTCGKVNIRIA